MLLNCKVLCPRRCCTRADQEETITDRQVDIRAPLPRRCEIGGLVRIEVLNANIPSVHNIEVARNIAREDVADPATERHVRSHGHIVTATDNRHRIRQSALGDIAYEGICEVRTSDDKEAFARIQNRVRSPFASRREERRLGGVKVLNARIPPVNDGEIRRAGDDRAQVVVRAVERIAHQHVVTRTERFVNVTDNV